LKRENPQIRREKTHLPITFGKEGGKDDRDQMVPKRGLRWALAQTLKTNSGKSEEGKEGGKFAGPKGAPLFDRGIVKGSCLDPDTIMNSGGGKSPFFVVCPCGQKKGYRKLGEEASVGESFSRRGNAVSNMGRGCSSGGIRWLGEPGLTKKRKKSLTVPENYPLKRCEGKTSAAGMEKGEGRTSSPLSQERSQTSARKERGMATYFLKPPVEEDEVVEKSRLYGENYLKKRG